MQLQSNKQTTAGIIFYHPLPRKQRPFFGNSGELWRIENGLWRDHRFLKRNILAVTFFELCLNLWAAQVELFQLLLFAHAHSQRILINLPHHFRTVLAIVAPREAEIIRFAEITFCRLRQFCCCLTLSPPSTRRTTYLPFSPWAIHCLSGCISPGRPLQNVGLLLRITSIPVWL